MSASVASSAPATLEMGRPLYVLCVVLFVLSWSSAFPAAKIGIGTSPPLLFLGIRFTVAGVLLVGYALVAGGGRLGAFDGRGVPWLALGALGLVNQAGYQGLFWMGMRTNSAGMATVIGSLSPILVAAAAVPLLHERLNVRRALGLLLGLAGAVYVVRNRVAMGESGAGVGFFALGMVAMVAGTLGFKRLAPAVSLPLAVGAQQVAAGLALLAIGGATESFAAIEFGRAFWLTMAWFVVVVSIGAFLLWFLLLRQGSAASASALHFLMPPIGLLMSWAVLGERLDPRDLLGIVPVAAGIWLVTRPSPASHVSTPRG